MPSLLILSSSITGHGLLGCSTNSLVENELSRDLVNLPLALTRVCPFHCDERSHLYTATRFLTIQQTWCVELWAYYGLQESKRALVIMQDCACIPEVMRTLILRGVNYCFHHLSCVMFWCWLVTDWLQSYIYTWNTINVCKSWVVLHTSSSLSETLFNSPFYPQLSLRP